MPFKDAAGLPRRNTARRAQGLCTSLLPLGRASSRLPADSGRSACFLRVPPPRGDTGPPPAPPVHPTSGDSRRQPHLSGPRPAVAESGSPSPATTHRGKPAIPALPSNNTLPWGGHRERKAPFPHWQGRRTSHAARGPDSSLFPSRMRGVTRPRMWRWGAGTTSPPAITSGARISPSLCETSFSTPHGGRRCMRPCGEATGAPEPLPRRRTPTLRPSRSSPPEAGPKPGRAAAPHSAPCAILSPPSRPPPPRGSGANTRGRASKQ